MKCNYKWWQQPAMVVCPKCLYTYVKWINYEEWRKK